MLDEPPTTDELLTAWRDAIRAAELAERLATMAAETAALADLNASVTEEIAQLAEQAGASATAAAARARVAADDAKSKARKSHDGQLADADDAKRATREFEAAARAAYHDAEAKARRRLVDGSHNGGGFCLGRLERDRSQGLHSVNPILHEGNDDDRRRAECGVARDDDRSRP